MSAMVCGKRSFFDDSQSPTPPAAKKLRQAVVAQSFADHLKAAFPEIENEIIEKTLEECDYDLDSAIERLSQLHLGFANGHEKNDCASGPEEEALRSQDELKERNLPSNGEQWVELFVTEMMSASSIDDAKCRATRVLGSLERSISAQNAEATLNLEKENTMLKEQKEAVLRDNTILKRAFAIQHERLKECNIRDKEVQILKDALTEYQERLRTLEVKNYALELHLKQAQQGNSMPGRFPPNVF